MKSFLHVGCGPKHKDQTTIGFNTDEWQEIRFDIDESVQPDLVGTMTDMSSVESESVDALFSSHNIEHLYPHEVPVALKEPIDDALPLNVMLETVTPGPKSTFCTRFNGDIETLVTNCPL